MKVQLDLPLVPEPGEVAIPEPETREPELVTVLATGTEPVVLSPEPAPSLPVVAGRPSQVTRKPIRYGDYKRNPCMAQQKDEGIGTSPV